MTEKEKPTSFQISKDLRARMKTVASEEKFPTMIAWLKNQILEGEKRIKNKEESHEV